MKFCFLDKIFLVLLLEELSGDLFAFQIDKLSVDESLKLSSGVMGPQDGTEDFQPVPGLGIGWERGRPRTGNSEIISDED